MTKEEAITLLRQRIQRADKETNMCKADGYPQTAAYWQGNSIAYANAIDIIEKKEL